jgi:hypothetical protein
MGWACDMVDNELAAARRGGTADKGIRSDAKAG